MRFLLEKIWFFLTALMLNDAVSKSLKSPDLPAKPLFYESAVPAQAWRLYDIVTPILWRVPRCEGWNFCFSIACGRTMAAVNYRRCLRVGGNRA
jgi:hypothetical protein